MFLSFHALEMLIRICHNALALSIVIWVFIDQSSSNSCQLGSVCSFVELVPPGFNVVNLLD
jgi:hypothetical protein